ncbi:DUF349 domain-containing protein [Pricia sp. S334]|uniref:DUF349 domain-containing protein n=1 Tax=Pricia mediterranea TaxID=3076079 RepID=A0ABU3L866_9FLAO|nr:DUF349 domain-containing protein [Pricia sp. S334]MDT7829949.1 DUF349 domain-containing protein [Pricia sp. S334]
MGTDKDKRLQGERSEEKTERSEAEEIAQPGKTQIQNQTSKKRNKAKQDQKSNDDGAASTGLSETNEESAVSAEEADGSYKNNGTRTEEVTSSEMSDFKPQEPKVEGLPKAEEIIKNSEVEKIGDTTAETSQSGTSEEKTHAPGSEESTTSFEQREEANGATGAVSKKATQHQKSENKTSRKEDSEDKTSPNKPSEENGIQKENPTKEKHQLEEEDEILDSENAEDAEDVDNERRHAIPLLDYEAMSMENLVGELQKLIRNEKIQAIKKHVDAIKYEFDQKFDAFLEEKKEKFVESGGNEIDFRYNSTVKRDFSEIYKEYREKRNQYYKNLEKNLKENLSQRLAIIEELKGLMSVEEDMGTTYKAFKDLQEKWRNAGPIPRNSYNNVWRTYRHHTEIFYDFLHLNREMRDFDFKRNLEEKEKLVHRAEALAKEPDLNRVFRELQALHKIWKEDIGPVGQAHREEIWQRFSKATKVLHQRRQEHYRELEAIYVKNLEKKSVIIASITELGNNVANNHKDLQTQIKQLEAYRKDFFETGKVPRNKNRKTWSSFKEAVRRFNRSKNAFYKDLKQKEQANLDKKRELVELAASLKDSDDFEAVTPKMKRIQAEWKKIGHVPRKYSNKIWKEFKSACNHYFDRLHALKNKGREEEEANFKNKTASLEKLSGFEPSGNREEDLKAVKSFIASWKTLGRVPFKKRNIDQKFNNALDGIFKKMGVPPEEAELLKYGNKIQRLADSDNEHALQKERNFIRNKIEETKGEIRQLETNLQFFSNASDDNPLLQDVIKKVDAHKVALETWKAKLKKLNIMKNSMQRELDAEKEQEASEGAEAPES